MKPCCYQTVTLLNALANAVDHHFSYAHAVVDALHEIPDQCEACGLESSKLERGHGGLYACGPSALEIHAVKDYCAAAVARICRTQEQNTIPRKE